MAGVRVTICGVNTKDLPLLSAKDKKELLTKIKAGDNSAREAFIKGNLRLVLSIVGRFSNSNENMDDLFQIGCIGLIKAIDNFDLGQGVQFSTYAVPMIIGEIKRYLRDNSAIRVSRSLKDMAYKAIYTKEQLLKKNQHEPTISEIAGEIGVSKEDIVIALEAVSPTVSLYEPVFNEGQDTLYVIDQLKDSKDGEDSWVTHLALNDAYRKLDSREQQIIKMRFYEYKTQMEIASEIGISQAQVSRLEKCALKNMKGLIPNTEKRRFHAMGLHKPIAHLNAGIHQDFIVVDNICGDLDFEDGGNPVVMNRIWAGMDPVLIDSYVCQVMHYETKDVPYIGLAEELGVGSTDLKNAHIIYCEESARKELPKSRKVVELQDAVEEVESCSACYGYLIPALEMLKNDGLFEKLDTKICIGQGYRGKTGKLGVGACTCKFEHNVNGCPPTENQIYDFLKQYILNK